MRAVANRSWRSVLTEAKKCELLCSNCHAEVHRPDLAFENLCKLTGEHQTSHLRFAVRAAASEVSTPLGKSGRHPVAAELPLGKLRERQSRAVFQVGADDLHADRQAAAAEADGYRRRRQPRQGSGA